ncbi:PKD domain-containing protein [Candidatus Parcubacteria bacterium]|nr:PKD domain-containing protein [Candidatus Parcubacteria bacterium]
MNTAIRQIKNIKHIVFVMALFVFYFNLFCCNNANAADTENVLGWAWSENIGWISFNDLNCDIDGDGKYNDDGLNDCPNDDSDVFPYGVNLDVADNLSGYAWNNNIGWISFEPADIAGCPAGVCQPSLAGGIFSGWARALNHGGGWDGWISLNCANNGGCAVSNYSTSLNDSDFEGWAWGDVVVGWVSFNSTNTGAVIPYKVYLTNNAPTVVPNSPALIDYCVSNLPGGVTLSWTFSDTEDDANSIDQTAYEVEITRSDAALPCLTGKQITTDEFIMSTGIGGIDSFCPGFIDYGGFTYNWQVRVYDSDGADSGFVQELSSFPFDSFPSDGPTPIHRYPTANFSYTPPLPILQFQEITFDPLDPLNLSIAYGGASIASFEWNFDDGTPNLISDPLIDGGVVTHSYSEINLFTVDLKVTDDTLPVGYSCWASQHIPTNTEDIPIGTNRPGWNETTP